MLYRHGHKPAGKNPSIVPVRRKSAFRTSDEILSKGKKFLRQIDTTKIRQQTNGLLPDFLGFIAMLFYCDTILWFRY
jgi:hypothetical protein